MSSKLLEFFTEHEFFELEKDFNKICLVSDTDSDKAAVLVALEELTKQNFLVRKEFEAHTYFILFKPLTMHTQDVTVSVSLGVEIASILNAIFPDENRKCNPLNLSEEDIFHLLLITKNVLSDKDKK